MEYIIYSDESDRNGKFYGNFYGAALVRSRDINHIEQTLNKLKISLNLLAEIKWTKVPSHEVYYERYIRVMDQFLDFVKSDLVKIRIMFSQNIHVPIVTKDQKDNEFLLLYYQFIKHCFGLKYCDEVRSGEVIKIKFFFDDLPSPKIDAATFKNYIYMLDTKQAFGNSFRIDREDMAEVSSKNHVIMQCLDIVLGSMCFRLNNKHLDKPPGQYRRSKGTVFKEKMYHYILLRIKEIYPNFNIGMSTGRSKSEDVWNHSYRHWNFVPSKHVLDLDAGKRRKGPIIPRS